MVEKLTDSTAEKKSHVSPGIHMSLSIVNGTLVIVMTGAPESWLFGASWKAPSMNLFSIIQQKALTVS